MPHPRRLTTTSVAAAHRILAASTDPRYDAPFQGGLVPVILRQLGKLLAERLAEPGDLTVHIDMRKLKDAEGISVPVPRPQELAGPFRLPPRPKVCRPATAGVPAALHRHRRLVLAGLQ